MNENQFPNIFDDEQFNINHRKIKKLERPANDFIISGLCAGLGNYFSIDVSIIRFIGMISLLVSFIPLYFYIIGIILFPPETERQNISEHEKTKISKRNFYTVCSGLIILISMSFLMKNIGITKSAFTDFDSLFTNFAIISLGLYIIYKNSEFEVNSSSYFNSAGKKKILGVCKILSDYLKIDVTTIRVFFLVCTLLSFGIIILLYVILFLAFNIKENSYEN